LAQKVLSIVSTLWRCGPTNVLEGIVRGYDPAKYQAIVATLSPNPADSILQELRSIGIRVEEMNLSRAASFLFGAERLRELVQALKVDLVHCHGFRADVLASKGRLQVPTVATIHSDNLTNYQLFYGRVSGKWMARREFAALRDFYRVIAVSDTVAARVRSQGLQCEVIENGVDVNRYRPPSGASEKAILRERLRLSQEQLVVLHTGRLTNLKQPVEVIGGFLGSRVSRDAVLLVAGEGPLRQQCEKAAAGARNVLFLGKRQDLLDLLRASDVLISNSCTEGMPLALLEGCACGMRVIVSDIPPHRRIRSLFAQQVLLYPGHEPHAVAAALDEHATTEIAHTLQPRRESLEAISASRMSREYQSVYDSLCARNT